MRSTVSFNRTFRSLAFPVIRRLTSQASSRPWVRSATRASMSSAVFVEATGGSSCLAAAAGCGSEALDKSLLFNSSDSGWEAGISATNTRDGSPTADNFFNSSSSSATRAFNASTSRMLIGAGGSSFPENNFSYCPRILSPRIKLSSFFDIRVFAIKTTST